MEFEYDKTVKVLESIRKMADENSNNTKITINGVEYHTDTGYALEGMDIMIDSFKRYSEEQKREEELRKIAFSYCQDKPMNEKCIGCGIDLVDVTTMRDLLDGLYEAHYCTSINASGFCNRDGITYGAGGDNDG